MKRRYTFVTLVSLLSIFFHFLANARSDSPLTSPILESSAVSCSFINLTWSDKNRAIGYIIERSISSTGNFNEIATIKNNHTNTYTDTNLKGGTTYYYRVKVYNKTAFAYSNISKATTFPEDPSTIIGTYYVSKNGNDYNPGTELYPWLTISYAASKAKAGDTVYVKEGVYNEKVRFTNDGTENTYITFKTYGTDKVTIDYTGIDDHVVLFTKAYIIFDGFKIISHKFQPVRLNPGAHHIIIRNCELAPSSLGVTYHGLLIESDSVHHITIQNCSIHGHGYATLHHGMYIKGDYHVIEYNTIYDNAQHGIHLYNGSGSVRHNIIRYNTCYDNGKRSNNGGSGIIVTQGDNLITNNICFNNTSYGINIFQVSSGEGFLGVYNNVLYNNNKAGIGINSSYNVEFTNNIVKDNSSNIWMVDSYNLAMNHNCYYPDGPNAFLWARISCDFAHYKQVSGQDLNSTICQDSNSAAYADPANVSSIGIQINDVTQYSPEWVQSFEREANKSGDMILAGWFEKNNDCKGIFIVENRGTEGIFLWEKIIKGNGSVYPEAVAVDSNGDVVLKGKFQGTVDFGSELLISSEIENFVAEFSKTGEYYRLRQLKEDALSQ